MSLQVLRSSDADLDAYAVWAASVAAEDSTIDGDGLLSASHATHVMLQRFASGEQAIAPAFGNSTKTIHLAQLHFVEYRDEESNSLAGLLVANLGADEAEPVRILRVLVSQDHRSGGVARPSKSVMTQLGHALITHAIRHRSHGSTLPPRIDFRLAEVACVMAHMPKWSRIFETYAQQTPAPGCTQIIIGSLRSSCGGPLPPLPCTLPPLSSEQLVRASCRPGRRPESLLLRGSSARSSE